MTRINPHRITVALNRAGLYGPTADAKLSAVEPDLDNWEAGKAHPSDAQLVKLARMANVPVEFFTLPDGEHPELTVAWVCNRRTGHLLVSMPHDPYPPAQPSLLQPDAEETTHG